MAKRTKTVVKKPVEPTFPQDLFVIDDYGWTVVGPTLTDPAPTGMGLKDGTKVALYQRVVTGTYRVSARFDEDDPA